MSRALFVVLLSLLDILGTPGPASANDCNFAPFTLNNGIPMPGMRDGRLDFESAEVCAALPRALEGPVSRTGFLDLQVHGTPVADVVPLGGGLLAPSRRMGCRPGRERSTRILFEDGELLLTAPGGGLTPAMATHLLVAVWPNWIRIPKIPRECKARYEAALLDALYPDARSITEDDLVNIAATQPDSCSGDNFRAALRGVAARWVFTWGRTPFIWARVGDCLLNGPAHKPDEHALGLRCPGMGGEAIVVVPPSMLPAFVGANQGMTADATIHPMDETCLSAWATWRAHRSPNRTE